MNSSKEDGWKPGDFQENGLNLHDDNIFDAANNSYSKDQELNAVDEVRQLTTSRQHYGPNHVPAELYERTLHVSYADYLVYDDWTQEFIVLQHFWGSHHAGK